MKKTEKEGEEHMNRLCLKKVNKLEKETKRLRETTEEEKAKINEVQQKIFERNQTLERLKAQINLNQEDMEKWMMAAKQKKEDNLMLEKYKRADETKVKEIGLEIQRLTMERGKLEAQLAKQITETKACQIEVDKLMEGFEQLSTDRKRVFAQWDSVVMSLAKRNELKLEISRNMASIKQEIDGKQKKVEEKKNYIDRETKQNSEKRGEVKRLERLNFQLKNINQGHLHESLDFQAQIKIVQNRLSGRASELESKIFSLIYFTIFKHFGIRILIKFE